VLSEQDIILNNIAQDKISIEEGIMWFDNKSIIEQRQIVTLLRVYLEQSHPQQKLIDEAIPSVPLKQTMTPIVIFKTNPFKIATIKVNDLPDDEMKKAFITFISLFKVSDTFRRVNWCKGECNHDWHNLEKVSNHKVSFFKKLTQLLRFKN